MHRRRSFLVAALLALATTAGWATFAFTASNTVPAGNAGAGTGAVSGYTVSSVDYVLNATNPENIDKVTFSLTPTTADTVYAKLGDGTTSTTYSCTNTAGAVVCPTTAPQATVAPTAELTVIATD